MNAQITTQGGKDRFAEVNADFFEDLLHPGSRNVFLEGSCQTHAQFFLYFSPTPVDIIRTHDELLFDKLLWSLFFIGERSSLY